MKFILGFGAVLLSLSTVSYAARNAPSVQNNMTPHQQCMSMHNNNEAVCKCAIEKAYIPLAKNTRDSMIKVNENLQLNEEKRLSQILADPTIDENALAQMCAPRKELAAFYEAHPFDLNLSKEEKAKVKALRYNKAKEMENIIKKVDAKYITHLTKTQLSNTKDCDPRDVLVRLDEEQAEIEKSFQEQTLKVHSAVFKNRIRAECFEFIK